MEKFRLLKIEVSTDEELMGVRMMMGGDWKNIGQKIASGGIGPKDMVPFFEDMFKDMVTRKVNSE